MIIRRLSQGIRQQDWFVVGVEILTVVIGLFIGLQLDDWNQARKDRQEGIRYLERIANNLVQDEAELIQAVGIAEARAQRGRFLLAALEDPQLVEEQPKYFIQSIEMASYTYRVTLESHTFDEIKFNGKLSLIENEDMRSSLMQYYDSFDRANQWDYIVQASQLHYGQSKEGLFNAPQIISMSLANRSQVEYSAEDAREVLARLANKPQLIAAIAAQIRIQLDAATRAQNQMEKAQKLLTSVRAEIARLREN